MLVSHYRRDPVLPGERRDGPRVPDGVIEQRARSYDDEARAGPNITVLGDPLPGRSALDQRRRRNLRSRLD